jgi:hypothetical protein
MMINIGCEAGGAEKIVKLTRDAPRKRGHEVIVVSTDFKLGDRTPFADVIVPRRISRGRGSLRSRFWDRDVYQKLKDTINEMNDNLIGTKDRGLGLQRCAKITLT